VQPALVQDTLRLIFTEWGRPKSMRVDNGVPWGSQGDWPTDLALWLIGLGVDMIWNPARRPQDNGVVERSQGTGKRWGEPGTCKDAEELQRRLEAMDRIQREVYPSIGKASRCQAFPTLRQNDRLYSKKWEKAEWRLQRVLDHMADEQAQRRVDCKGQVSIYGRSYYVGKKLKGQVVHVFLDPVDREWVFATPKGVQLIRKVAEQLTQENIQKLKVTNRRDSENQVGGKTECRN
jgi:hypothetical protein